MADSPPGEGAVSLVAGRSKRSTAGNRMRALLDQQHNLSTTDEADEIFREEDNDVEFAAPQREEEDVFDSDFGDSSDEEGQDGRKKGGDDESEGERELEAEEERKRKAARKQASRMAPSVVRRPAKAKPPPSALHSGSRDEDVQAEAGPSRPTRTSRRISFAPDARAGDTSVDPNSSSRRISSRRATVQAGLDSQVRIEEAEARRLQHPNVRNPPSSVKKPSLNQAELIELALEREEENRKSLKEWMEVEEERKRKELGREKRALPSSWIRWRSVRSEVPIERPIIVLEPPTQPADADEKEALVANDSVVDVVTKPEPTAEQEADMSGPVIPAADVQAQESIQIAEPQADESTQVIGEADATANDSMQVIADEIQADVSGPVLPHQTSRSTSPQTMSQRVDFTLDPVLQARKEAAAAAAAAAASQKAAEASSSNTQGADVPPTELEARSLVSLHYTTRPAPPWPEQWASLLGSHTNWATTHVVPARNRPSKPRASLCAITGKMARYKDAKTGIPFADVKAARVLRALGEEQWEWCEVDIDVKRAESGSKTKADQTKVGDAGTTGDAEDGAVKKVKKSAKKITDGSAGGDGQGKTGFWILAQPRPSGGGAQTTATQATGEASSTTAPAPASALQGKASLKRKVSAMASPGTSRAASAKKTAAGRASQHASPATPISASSAPSPAPSAAQAAPTLSSRTPTAAPAAPAVEEVPPHLAALGIAPGDEQAVLARALALPSGTTRSGKARSSLPAGKK
ncbi:YL1-domain-containing protein [Microstroma glucosiphilum]|uniref:YL1-domain-containing protein n=1 Tax=Pseudomicrostroma glucosiphilum TaxID=1684307 RepID=A0A316U3M7_9BASI|nr:YL1-domain-containing protein [Pseudomicrostroma glucosiphilum]PWN19770.1 YL1-domain-containing protein [Pseudomicrostroma glucosiphilum]